MQKTVIPNHSFVLFNPLIGPSSGATTPGQSRPGSDANERVPRIPRNSNIAGTSPSDFLVSYTGHSMGGGLTPLQRSSQCILQPQSTRQPRKSFYKISTVVIRIEYTKARVRNGVGATEINAFLFIYLKSI